MQKNIRKLFSTLVIISLMIALVPGGVTQVKASAPLLDENFDYGGTAGNLTATTANWVAHSGSGTNPIQYVTSGLTMPSYASSGVGGAATFTTTGEDDNRTFASQSSGPLYFAALVNLSSAQATGDYFMHFKNSSTGFAARVFARNSSGNLQFGISTSSAATWSTTNFSLGTTYLVVAKHDMSTGASDIYVLTSCESTEPVTPLATATGTAVTPIVGIAIRQGNAANAPAGTIDGIRVANNWADAVTCGSTTPNLSINDVSAAETNSGTTTFSFTVALSSPAPAGGVSFNVDTTNGTAIAADGDYSALSTTGNIAEGLSAATVDVTINGDTDFESDETFYVDVTSVVGATVSDGQGQGTITNDDVALPILSINDVTIAEGNSGTTIYQFTVSMDATSAGDVTFNIDTADNTATIADNDYFLLSTTGTIAASSLSTTVDVTVNGDANIESTETFYVNVTSPSGATIGDGQGVGTITNDDAATPQISISNVSGPESDAGTNTLTFNISLDIPALAGGVTFDIDTSDGSATAGSDYAANSADAVTIAAGDSATTFNVTVNGDTTFEADETFTVTLSNVTGATVANGTGTGTIENDDAAPVNLSIADVTLAEGNTGTTTFGFVVTLDGPAPTGGVTFDIATSGGTATAGTDYVAQSITGQTIAAGGTTYNFDVTVNGDWDSESNETFNVNVTSVSGAVVTDGAALGTITNDDSAVTPIHDIQGSGNTSASGTFTVDAIVVGQYQAQTSGQLKGFFVQEQDADADANPATSEGIFVYCLTCPTAVNVGDRVLATGATSEYFNMSQLNATTAGSVVVLSSGNAMPTPASLTLPIPGVPTGDLTAAETFINAYYEAFEGMLVKFPATLSVSEYFELARYGQVILSAGGRPHTFTAVNTPTALGYTNHQIDLAARTIILDDTDNRQNRPSDVPNTAYFYPVPGLSTSNYFRGGDTITNLTGVLHWSFAGQTGTDAWRIRPVTEKYSYAFTPVNPRTTVPSVDGSLKVASFNVLNYFLTIDTSNVCAPTQNQDCRGADSTEELTRQRTKMLAALTAIDADVFGFMEMENTTGVEPLADIVAGLSGYDYIDTGVVGGDAIRVGIIYKTSTVTPVGAFKLLTSAVDPRFDDTKNRPALAQTFEEIATGETFTVVVNHLKSKGSSCGTGDDDTTTGQGNCNLTRTEAAEALADWLDTDPTGSGDPDFLIIGDLNSYAMEDPIVALETAGFTNLVESFGGADAYGYVFDGQLGYLDHALTNTSMTPQVADLAEWHINADENPLFDYNDDVRTADEAAFDEESDTFPLYAPNEFRTSDHDPIIIGLNLDSTRPAVSMSSIASSTTNTSPIPVTVQFSETVTGFVAGDITTVNGSVGDFLAVDGDTYTFDLTPIAQGLVTADIAQNVAIDSMGNGNTAATQFSRTYDSVAPTITSIVPAGTNPTNASSVPFTVTFSEAVTSVDSTDFSLNISSGSISGATIGAISGAGTTWTVNVNTGSGDGVLRLDVKASADMHDLAGNNVSNLPFESGGEYTLDKTVPTVTMSSAALNPTKVSPIAVTVQFSEAVINFVAGDIATVNGSVSGFIAVDGDTYTFNLTPSGQGLVTADIAQNAASDDAGNGNTQATQFSRTYDSVVPTVTMSSVVSDPVHNTSPISVTVQFSETVSGFTIDDITAVNGSVSNFAAVDGDTYTFKLTPSSTGLVTADIGEDAASDAAGNGNTAAAQFQRTYSLHTLFLPLIKR